MVSVSCFLQVGDNSKVQSALYLPNQKWCGASLSIFCFLKLKSETAVTCPHGTEGGDKSPDIHGLSFFALCLLSSHRILHFLPLPFLAVGIKIYFKFSHFRVSLASYKCCTIKYIFMSAQAGWLPCQETEPCRWAGGRMTDTQLPMACCLYL